MTYFYATTAYLLASPLLALAHIANVYLCEYRANARARRAREDEVRDLEWLFDMEAREPAGREV